MSDKAAPPVLALDVDGVLIDGFPKKHWSAELEAHLGIRPDRMQEHFFKVHWQEIVRGQKPVEPFLEGFLAQEGSSVSALELLAYWHEKDAAVREDVRAAARAWKNRTGGRLALATNQDRTRATYLRDNLGFGMDFEVFVVSCDIGVVKPDPAFFVKADELLERLPGQEVIFLDDMMGNVEAARTHGWTAHHVELPEVAADLIKAL